VLLTDNELRLSPDCKDFTSVIMAALLVRMFRLTARSTPSALRLTAMGFGVSSPIMSAAALISQRWCSSTTAQPKYYVSRTKSDQLPVYSEYRNGRTRVLTILRRITGDYEVRSGALCLPRCGVSQSSRH
jgi:hypothetical protein